MTRGFDPPLSLQVLRSATTLQKQLDALKQLKNDIIGHEKRKHLVISNGVSELLSRCLALRRSRGHQSPSTTQSLDPVDQVKLQALFTVSSLSHAGNPYIAPLLNGRIIPPLVAILIDPSSNPRLVVETLRALALIVTNLHDDPLENYTQLRAAVYEQVISSDTIGPFARILEQEEKSRLGDEQFTLLLQIIRHVAQGETACRGLLVQAGILDLLASKLATWVVSYQPAFKGDYSTVFTRRSTPPPQGCFCDLVLAIAAIVRDSAYRSFRFFYSQDILTIFPTAPAILFQELPTTFPDMPHSSISHPWERLLPQLTASQSKSESGPRGFPALSSLGTIEQSRVPFVSQNAVTVWPRRPDELSSNLIAWLVHMARSTQRNERISILWLLAVLLNATRLNERFGKPLSLLIVPILIRLITDEPLNWLSTESKPEISPELILAELIKGSDTLQAAAVEAESIKILCSKLKKSFDPVKLTPSTMWSPTPSSSTPEQRSLTSATLLGPPTPSPILSNTLRYRSDAMRALASLAEKENANRLDVLNYNIIQCLLDALLPYPSRQLFSDPQPQFSRPIDTTDPKSGNPNFVMISALKLLVALSRSTHVLRTSLIDGNVAKPVFDLLKHDDMAVQLAATDVTINLILHFSPMKDELVGSGVLKILCAHAHSANPEMRISALWALKHLVLNATDKVKEQAFDELGSGFLMQLLTGDSAKTHLSAPNALGEKVDLLNDEPAIDIDGESSSSDDDSLYGGEVKDSLKTRYGPAEDYASRLRPLKTSEENPSYKARRDAIRIQHHALDFLRNVLCEPSSSHSALVDQILGNMGISRFFDVVISKIRQRPGQHVSTSGKRPTLTTPSASTMHTERVVIDANLYCHPDIVLAALYILIHIANGNPPHRQMVIQQPNLIACVIPLFSHPNDKIRVACCWLVHNLLWVEDGSDKKGAKQRALDLQRAGVEDEIRKAMKDDTLDVKERAKACLESFTKLLETSSDSLMVARPWDRQTPMP